jgi:concentrative nucleoside transporter, CNT family
MAEGGLIHPRSAIIASYALCGFAHIASLAIFIGGLGALAPERLKDFTRVGFKALLAATLACLMTGAVAGVFYSSGSILLR